ncbi:MAG TPA: hypothetical protein EYG51_22115 [Pseudomonadales bacterium]|nr:hypothetical protein [Pseudomonadales bacterium]
MRAKIHVGDLIVVHGYTVDDPAKNRSSQCGIYLGCKTRLTDPGESPNARRRVSNWHMILVGGNIKLIHKKYLTDSRVNVLSSLGR